MEERKNRKSCLLYPEDSFYKIWSNYISVVLFVACIFTPWEIAFYNDSSMLSYFIDIMFVFDIIITFNSAFENDMLETIDDRKAIAKNYIKGWFLLDLLSVMPFDLIF